MENFSSNFAADRVSLNTVNSASFDMNLFRLNNFFFDCKLMRYTYQLQK